jgi:serine/threonine protein phosphatase 1
MLPHFLRNALSRPGEGADAPLPRPDPPVCVVGDVHGCVTLLDRLLDRIAAEPGAARARLIFVGDLLDRGPDSAAVLLRVRALCDGGRAVALRGNHESMAIAFLDAPEEGGPSWLANGGDATLFSLGVNPHGRPGMADLARAFRAALPPGMEAWLRALPLSWREDALAVSHAGADPARPFEDQDDRVLMWGHRNFRRRARTDGLWIVHGHVIQPEVQARAGRIGVDTGAFATGRLSAVWLDRDGMRVIAAED